MLIKSTTSGDKKTWNISPSTNANQCNWCQHPYFQGWKICLCCYLFTFLPLEGTINNY